MDKFAIYIRVSTKKQGSSGLGLEAQMEICQNYISSVGGEMLRQFMDVESGTHRDRPGLNDALAFCKENKCTLVIAKLDRLCRDIEFTFKIMNSGIQIHFCDMPVVNTMILGVFATVAQYERELTAKRTKDALAAKKAQGYKLGRPKGCDTAKAVSAMRKATIMRALEDPLNKIIWGIVKECKCRIDFEQAALKLQEMGIKTHTGKEFNYSRTYAMYQKIKKRKSMEL